MNRITRFSMAVLLVVILALTASGVWASQKFAGTVPTVPPSGGGTDPGGVVDMGTALFTPVDSNSTISVDRISPDCTTAAPAPDGVVCLADAFLLTVEPATAVVKVCYAYPPEYAEKEAKIYKLNEEANPHVWVEVPGAEIGDGTICVTTTGGYIGLIGKP